MKTTIIAVITAISFFISCTKETTVNVTAGIKKGLVVYYEFANNLMDSSGNNFNGIDDTAIDFVPDRLSRMNQAIRFNGPDHNSCFTVPALGSKQAIDKFSVSFWFTFTSVNNDNLLFKGDAAEGAESAQTLLINNGRLRIILGDGVNNTKEFDGKALLKTNTWYHVALVFNGVEDIRIYLDGVFYNDQMQTTTNNINVFAFKSNAAQAQGLIGGKAPYPLTDGKMDDFRLYNRAISEAEALALYNYR